jgi:plastocyanin
MPPRRTLALLITVIVGGCSSSSSPTMTPPVDAPRPPVDAAPRIDAPPATVMTVTCPATPDAMVTSSNSNDSSYTPKTTTINVGQVVQFVMSSSHNVAPSPAGMTDTGLMVGFGGTACLMFTKAGTFDFYCTTHSFTGTVVVH